MVQLANRTSLKHKNLYWWIRNRGFLVVYTSPTPLVVGLFESDPVLRFIIQVLKPFWREESISGDLIHAPKNKSDLWMRICARTQFLNARNPGHQGRGFSIRGGAWHLKICVLTTWVKFRWIYFFVVLHSSPIHFTAKALKFDFLIEPLGHLPFSVDRRRSLCMLSPPPIPAPSLE